MPSSIPCRNCQQPLRDGAAFCVHCGTPAIPITAAPAASVWGAAPADHEATITVGAGHVMVLGSLGRRTAARAIDTAIVAAVCGIILTIGGITASVATAPTIDSYYGYSSPEPTVGAGAMFIAVLLALLFAGAYEVVAVAVWGRTVGKAACGLIVRDRRTGNTPTLGGAVLRWVTPGIGSLIPLLAPVGALIVYLSPVFDTTGTRQGWHDRLASTIVTRR